MPVIFLFFFFLFLLPITAQDHNFTFNGFRQAAPTIYLNGVAQIRPNGILRLTSQTPRLLGHAFYQSPIRFKTNSANASSFSTSFAFAIVPEYPKLGGHGFAFTISRSRQMTNALPSQYLGLMNASDVGNFSNHVVAVEFDTVQDFEFGDINDNHIGIDLNSLVSNASVDATYFDNGKKEGFNLKSGRPIQAWIDYDSSRQQLDVSLSDSSVKPTKSILSFPVDLSPIFLDYMYVGFSASTGLLASSHYILGWSFAVNGEAQSLDLASLPSVPRPKKNHLSMILGTSLSIVIFLLLVGLTTLYVVRRIKNRDVVESWELDVGPHRFSYRELKKATKGFRDKELLGFGGFGKVYKGTLPDANIQVAVKRINNESKQGLREFASEISSIGRLRHRNLVTLQGWCRQRDDLLLVYDFMPNGSLDKYIFDDPKTVLTWEQRFKILRGVASGLLYLHEGWEQTVIHRDIKAGNVLLDSDMNARLGDFGLAKLYEHGANPSTTKVVGTLGYLAPELTRTGKPTTSSDVYAFGALVLEVVCGRRPVEAKALPEELVLVEWVWEKWREGCVLEVVDRRLEGAYIEMEVMVALKVGLMCSNNDPGRRPSMREVVRYLEGEAPMPEVVVLQDKSGEKGSSRSARFGLGLGDLEDSFPTSLLCEYDEAGGDEGQSGSTFSESGRGGWRWKG